MTEVSLFGADLPSSLHSRVASGEALSTSRRRASPPAAFGDAQCWRFEFTSRGDRVPGRLLLPAEDAHPLPAAGYPWVLLLHGLGGSKDSEYLEVAARWISEGAAIATIDLPLHGERASPKLSERLLRAASQPAGTQSTNDITLLSEFARQALIDMQRCCDCVSAMPESDAQRLAFAGFSLGAMLGVPFCALDPRPRAAVLALAGAGLGPASIDPASFASAIAPRPLVMVNARNDERVPPASVEALYQAASQPKDLTWFDSDHSALPGNAIKVMWQALRKALEL